MNIKNIAILVMLSTLVTTMTHAVKPVEYITEVIDDGQRTYGQVSNFWVGLGMDMETRVALLNNNVTGVSYVRHDDTLGYHYGEYYVYNGKADLLVVGWTAMSYISTDPKIHKSVMVIRNDDNSVTIYQPGEVPYLNNTKETL